MSEPIVKVENLSHRFSVQWAVKDISFELHKKGIYGLLGANGAGKSTIMNIMCGVLKQTSGDVFIKGINMSADPVEAKKLIGFLPQNPPLQNELTVGEYLTYCAHLRLMPQATIEAAVTEVMETCSLSHFRNRIIKNLSGGYKQRVGIAQAIIHKPEFVVFDEPTNGLDPNQILEVRKLIKSIAQERTVVLSTHILQEVQALCDNIWMINEGKVIFSGTIHEFDSYITPSSIHVSLMGLVDTKYLEAVEGVVGVEHVSGYDYMVHLSDDVTTVIERIVQKSVQEQWRLIEITKQKNSLETIFAELSRK